ncbi:MAG: hypothetical protein K1W35_15150 [Lachnospiraceae bacterium]|jgi:hypothetical protein
MQVGLCVLSVEEEHRFYKDIHEILEHAKNTAYAAVNDIMTYAYWDIGEREFPVTRFI